MQDDKSQQLVINSASQNVVFEKYGYSLTQEALDYILSLKVDSVDICGIQTDARVYAISLQLWDNGIFPNILINYTATDPRREEIARQILEHQFGKVDDRP